MRVGELGYFPYALRYCRAVFAEPFNKKAKAVLPSSRAVGVDGLLPNVKSNPPAVSPVINTPAMMSIIMPSRRGAGRRWLICLSKSSRSWRFILFSSQPLFIKNSSYPSIVPAGMRRQMTQSHALRSSWSQKRRVSR